MTSYPTPPAAPKKRQYIDPSCSTYEARETLDMMKAHIEEIKKTRKTYKLIQPGVNLPSRVECTEEHVADFLKAGFVEI